MILTIQPADRDYEMKTAQQECPIDVREQEFKHAGDQPQDSGAAVVLGVLCA